VIQKLSTLEGLSVQKLSTLESLSVQRFMYYFSEYSVMTMLDMNLSG